MKGVLVYSERQDIAFDLLQWAKSNEQFLGKVNAAVLGSNAAERASAYRSFRPDGIYVIEDPRLSDLVDEEIAACLDHIVEHATADLVLMGATRRGKSLAPRVAEMIDAGCVSEATSLSLQQGELIMTRYALGGNTISREKISSACKVVAVTPGAVDPAIPQEPSGEVIPLSFPLPAPRVKVLERRPKKAAEASITESDRLVCVGRGLRRKEDLGMVRELASRLGAEVACTRPLSNELGWLSGDRMIGISGQKCSPRLIISLGVSGQVQHAVGVMGSKTIVAINNDPSAPIFKIADYGMVGDIYEVVPALTEALGVRSGGWKPVNPD